MIDISKTVLALSVAPDNVTQEELRDIDECLRVLYTTPMGSQEGDRRLGINVEAVLDKGAAGRVYGRRYATRNDRAKGGVYDCHRLRNLQTCQR